MLGGREPAPDRARRAPEVAAVATQRRDQLELLGAGARQKRPDQLVLAAKQEQQDARARTDRSGERAQRELGQAVLLDIGVGELEQLVATR